MASYILYPPIVDGAMPAFIAGDNSYCRIYFSLSKFNSSIDFKKAHVSIVKQDTGEKVVNPVDGDGVYRAAGIIIDMPVVIESKDDNIYYVDIKSSNLITNNEKYNGWVPGIIYKVQLRLSEVSYAKDNDQGYGQSTWLNAYASNFSEWSTICVVKPTCKPKFEFTGLKDNSEIKTNNIIGTYINEDTTEPLYNYKFILEENGKVLEDSDWILSDRNINQSSIKYILKYNLEENHKYLIRFYYNTLNGYTNYPNDRLSEEELDKRKVEFNVTYPEGSQTLTTIDLSNLENPIKFTESAPHDSKESIINYSNLFDEEEEGRIAYCLDGVQAKTEAGIDFTGVFYIRRTDSTTNFRVWEDIRIITKDLEDNNHYHFKKDIYYDYTIKDGIFYKYGIQPEVISNGAKIRGKFKPLTNPSIRDLNYSFLVGRNEQQLKLKFNNTINSLKINVTDSTNNTIGGVYPISRRVGNTKYKTFSINGLISFNMDENYLFIPKVTIYNNYDEVQELYKQREIGQGVYNMAYEREFRDKVLEFLTDGKVKLFKSPTEGDILVKLTDVSCTPNQQLSRLIYDFSATATEQAKYNLDNCIKYKITIPEEDGNRTNIKMKDYPHSDISPSTHKEV